MKKMPFCNFILAGVSLNEYGLKIPSPFASLSISNGQIQSMTSWTLNITVGGDDSKRVNVAAFEALLYSAAQSAGQYSNSSGIPVSFNFGWLDENGNVSEHLSYQGFTLQFKVSTSGRFLQYAVTGYVTNEVLVDRKEFTLDFEKYPSVERAVNNSGIGIAKSNFLHWLY